MIVYNAIQNAFIVRMNVRMEYEQSKPMDQNLIVVKSRSVMYDVEVMV